MLSYFSGFFCNPSAPYALARQARVPWRTMMSCALAEESSRRGRVMAGFSIILLMLVLWPFMLVGVLLTVAFAATVEFVTSPAFPVFLVSLVVSGIALIDVIRILWGHVRDKTLREMHLKEFVRPTILCLVAFLLFAVACIMTGSMLYTWWQSIETDVST